MAPKIATLSAVVAAAAGDPKGGKMGALWQRMQGSRKPDPHDAPAAQPPPGAAGDPGIDWDADRELETLMADFDRQATGKPGSASGALADVCQTVRSVPRLDQSIRRARDACEAARSALSDARLSLGTPGAPTTQTELQAWLQCMDELLRHNGRVCDALLDERQ